MLVLERSVPRECWEWTYRLITRRHKEGWSRKVARIRGHTVWMVQGMGLGTRSYYAIFEDTERGPRPMAWLMLDQRPGWFAWEVMQLWVFPKLRGLGLARKLYEAAINHDQLLLAAGKTHTKHSRAMWESFIRRNTFNIWAHDFSDLRSYCSVFWDEDALEVSSRLSLYSKARTNGIMNKNNVRLVALKRGSR